MTLRLMRGQDARREGANKHGAEQMLDAVYPAYLFQIEPVLDEANYLVWKTNYWGVTRLEDMRLRVV